MDRFISLMLVAFISGALSADVCKPQKDHLLVQVSGVLVKSQSNISKSCGWSVDRRRRDSSCSCRRRTGASNILDGWTCKNDVISSCGTDCPMGWPQQTKDWYEAEGDWCQIKPPMDDWKPDLTTCEQQVTNIVKVLTYNLFWWNLFGQNGGRDKSAGKLISSSSGPESYDVMAFQECDNRSRILQDAVSSGLPDEYEALDGGRAIAIAYRKTRWELLEWGSDDVGEDHHSQWYGKRSAMWVRLRDQTGMILFFMNHHGPLPVSKEGGCAGIATAYNIMQLIVGNAHAEDKIILVGDFNAESSCSRIRELDGRLTRVYSGTAMGGVDHIFTNCGQNVTARNLGKGGSDHDALSATFIF